MKLINILTPTSSNAEKADTKTNNGVSQSLAQMFILSLEKQFWIDEL